jgi:hypothetical protein
VDLIKLRSVDDERGSQPGAWLWLGGSAATRPPATSQHLSGLRSGRKFLEDRRTGQPLQERWRARGEVEYLCNYPYLQLEPIPGKVREQSQIRKDKACFVLLMLNMSNADDHEPHQKSDDELANPPTPRSGRKTEGAGKGSLPQQLDSPSLTPVDVPIISG